MTRYSLRLDCRWGSPHDFISVYENKTAKIERCRLCGVRKRWNKGYKGRIANNEYLAAHVRNFAQPGGRTKRIYLKLYEPKKCIISL